MSTWDKILAENTALTKELYLASMLSTAMDWLEHGIPTPCGRCGHPDASCDCECMNAAFYDEFRVKCIEVLKNYPLFKRDDDGGAS